MLEIAIRFLGAIALLLWAVSLVRSGVERGFMPQLRMVVRNSRKRPAMASVFGAAAAIALQSSTAVAILAAGFIRSGAITVSVGLTILLGADFGSAIVAWLLLTPVTWIIPALLVVGIGLYQRAERVVLRQTGRVLIGLALVFMALDMLRAATLPLREADVINLSIEHLSNDLLSAFVIGAVFTWILHSSVASVLTFATLLAQGVMALPLAASLILGANLGGALVAMTLTRSSASDTQNMIFGNLALRGGGALLALFTLRFWSPLLGEIAVAPQHQVILAHIGFNMLLATLGILLVRPILALTSSLQVTATPGEDSEMSALNDQDISSPEQALACASRETLRMGEQVRSMLNPVPRLFQEWDEPTARTILAREDEVDKMHFDIKLYIARMQEAQLTRDQSSRAMDIAAIAANLEEAGDQISSNLLDLAKRMHAEGLQFSRKGWLDITDFHDRVISNAQLALNVLMSGDPEIARQLVSEKDRIRQLEKSLQVRHLERLRKGKPSSIETSNLHQEIVRSLKQVNSAFCFIGYPIVERTGALLKSRLSSKS